MEHHGTLLFAVHDQIGLFWVPWSASQARMWAWVNTGLKKHIGSIQDGAPKIAKLAYEWLNSMVYGRYITMVNGAYFMVHKPTNITGFPNPVEIKGFSLPWWTSRMKSKEQANWWSRSGRKPRQWREWRIASAETEDELKESTSSKQVT